MKFVITFFLIITFAIFQNNTKHILKLNIYKAQID